MRRVHYVAGGVFISALVVAVIALGSSAAVMDSLAQASTCSGSDSVTPIGQVSPSPSGDPLIPVYCVPVPPPHAPTRVSGANDWVDDFDIGDGNMARFNDHDMGYRVFDNVGGADIITRHLVVGDHWIDDNRQPFGGMALLRPDRTFRFEGGKLVVEADVSAGKRVYSGDEWAEVTVTTADQPDRHTPDPPEFSYAYGHFHRFPTFGCRFQDTAENTCAGFLGANADYPDNGLPFTPTMDKAPCYSLTSDRLWELSSFQQCGSYFGGVHFGGFSNPSRDVWRACTGNQDYDECLDRFRIELTKSSLVLYVNGIRYFEDSGWDSDHQLPDSLVNGNVYVYFNDVGISRDTTPVRFHWERLAVNPHGPDGNFLPPSASPSFKGGPPSATNTPTPTPRPGASRTPTPTPSATATPGTQRSATPTFTPTATPRAQRSATPTLTPTATPRAQRSATPTPTPTADQSGGGLLVTFDDAQDPGRVLTGEYPTGVIDWGSGRWWLSGPYGDFSGQSVSFNGSGPTSAKFTFRGTRTLWQLDAFNGGDTTTTISVACAGHVTAQMTIPAHELRTIPVGWTQPCHTVTISSSNGWLTNFKNLKIK